MDGSFTASKTSPPPQSPSSAAEAPDDERLLRRHLAMQTFGASPMAVLTMLNDWSVHLAAAPDKQLALARKAHEHWSAWLRFVIQGCPAEPESKPIAAQEGDRRFGHESWSRAPYAAMEQAFLLAEDFFDTATSNIPGLTPAHDQAMTFMMRQMLDALAPSNYLATNPEAVARTLEAKGGNLQRGAHAFLRDWQAAVAGARPRPEKRVGQDVATTAGKVVFRNDLIELIQYAPTTKKVRPEPLLIVPAWIMKYYILDLSPENSMVRYLTAQGFTVFMISWRNPDAEQASLGMSDYLALGPMAALDYITSEQDTKRVHAAGYCLGGTLLSIAAAAMARDEDARLASLTLLTAQTDFSEAGELMLFINESQVSILEDIMARQGYLDSNQMMSAFQMLRSNDLVWSRMVRAYLLGETAAPMNDLMSWNADTTRMPARMHSEYLRQMFLNNDLACGRYIVDGHPVSLRDIRIPLFAVGTESDHIAPWKSVFKIHNLSRADVTFVLTNGGHNAGVVSEPGHRRRHYRIHTTADRDKALSPEDWLAAARLEEGSWWPAWSRWLADRSGPKSAAPAIKGGLCGAPGTYVLME